MKSKKLLTKEGAKLAAQMSRQISLLSSIYSSTDVTAKIDISGIDANTGHLFDVSLLVSHQDREFMDFINALGARLSAKLIEIY